MEALLGCEFADNSYLAHVTNALVLLSYNIIWTRRVNMSIFKTMCF